MLSILTAANVVGGLHAGDPETMARALARVGGRRGPSWLSQALGLRPPEVPFSTGEIECLVAYQIGAAAAVAAYAGHKITYLKPHGALGNISCKERPVMDEIA